MPAGGVSLPGDEEKALRRGIPLQCDQAGTLLLAVALSHCGSGGAPTQPSGGTPAGNYALVVTGSSGGVTRTINLTLQVN